MTQAIINITDHNESKFLIASGFVGTPSPFSRTSLVFQFVASEELFKARLAYTLNQPYPVLSFISASLYVDNRIYEHRSKSDRLWKSSVTPTNRILTACQKMKALSGYADLSKYIDQVIKAATYIEMNDGVRP